MRIFTGVPCIEGASNDSGVIENVDFQGFRTLGNEDNIILWYYLVPLTPKYMTLNDPEWLEWLYYVKFSLLRNDFESIISWLREYYLLIYCRVCLNRRDQRRRRKRSSGP